MAHFILKNGMEGVTFLHFNGSYHSDHYQGIVWYLKKFNQRNEFDLKILTISSVEQGSPEELDAKNIGLADFIICIPEDMTKTQAPSPMAGPIPAMTVPAVSNDKKLIKADTLAKPADTSGVETDEDDD
jgi:hypothetical protein